MDQQKTHQNNVDAIHQPCTAGMAKGKAHKNYALGNNVGLMATRGRQMIITAIGAFEGNPHDSQTTISMPGQPLKRDPRIENKRNRRSSDAQPLWNRSLATLKQNIGCQKTT